MTKSRRVDLFALIIYLAFLIPAILLFKVGFSVATILFFVVPSIYLAFRGSLPWKRIVYASLLFGFLLSQFDFIAEFNKAWVVPKLFFADRIFGVIGIDIIIWGFLWAFFILIFYEHFSEHDRSRKISKHFKILFIASLITCAIILARFYLNPAKLTMNYSYLFLGSVGLLVSFLIILKLKKPYFLLRKFLPTAIFFVFVHLAHELTALKLGQWYFPGQYLANINLSGLVFPIEELVFWILLGTLIVLAWYEYFVDDER